MRTSLTLISFVLGLSACTSGRSTTSVRSSPSTPASLVAAAPSPTVTPLILTRGATSAIGAAAWRRTDIVAASDPVSDGSTIVLYAYVGRQLEVLGLNPATGSTRWHADATVSNITEGVSPVLDVIAGHVALPEDIGGGHVVIVGVKATDGSEVWREPSGVIADWPSTCADDTTSFCTTVPEGVQVIRAVDGQTSILKNPLASRSIADDLYDTSARPANTILHLSTKGDRTWTKPAASLFGADDASTDSGWALTRDSKDGVYFGSVGRGSPDPADRTQRIDFSKESTAGFTIVAGESRWVDDGSDVFCAASLLPAGSQLPVRCRTKGVVTVSRNGTPTYSGGFASTIEGFDPTTGKTRWTYVAKDPSAIYAAASPTAVSPAHSAENSIVVPGGTDSSLDLVTGATTPLKPGATLWCQATTAIDPKEVVVRVLAPGWLPCDANGTALPVPVSVPVFVGAVADGFRVWSGPDGVTAAKA